MKYEDWMDLTKLNLSGKLTLIDVVARAGSPKRVFVGKDERCIFVYEYTANDDIVKECAVVIGDSDIIFIGYDLVKDK